MPHSRGKCGLLILLSMLLLLCGCLGKSSDRSVDTWSREYSDEAEKLAVLAEYLQCPTEPIDAEYHIVYWDNSGGMTTIPGPSDWAIDVALLLRPADLPLWLEGMEEIAHTEIDWGWWGELDLSGWPDPSAPRCYKRLESRSWAVADPESGVLFKHVTSI